MTLLAGLNARKVAFVLWKAPWQNGESLEWFDLIIAASAFEDSWGLFVFGEGIFYGASPLLNDSNGLREGRRSLSSLKYAEKGEILICEEAINQCDLKIRKEWISLPWVTISSAKKMRQRLLQYTHVLSG